MTKIVLNVDSALPVPGVTLPQFKMAGSSVKVPSYSFDAAATEGIQFVIPRFNDYTSGNLTLRLLWYADSATSGDVVWGGAIAAITPETDSTDIETDSFATENTVTDSHLGTTAQRIMVATITISNLDSLAAADYVALRIQRLGGNGSDTMSGDAQLVGVELEYS